MIRISGKCLPRGRTTATLLVLAAGLFSATTAFAIIGGVVDFSGHPYVGAIDSTAHGAPIVTSGVLISPTVFLTAGHVTSRFEVAGLTRARVTFDPVVIASSTWYVGTVHTNPAYNPTPVDDTGDLGVIVFDAPIPGITPALLPPENLLEKMGQKALNNTSFSVVGYGVSALVGGADGGGKPGPDVTSGGTRKVADESFLSLTPAWGRLGMHDNGAICAGDSGSPNLLGGSNMILGITIGGPSGCQNVNWIMRVDTPSHRAFLGRYVTLP
jgi:V8-like Glu-specific endopeptidase